MKITFVAFILIFTAHAFGQRTFDLTDASKFFDIRVKVAKCEETYCEGKAYFSFYKKGASIPYQVINLPDTQIQLVEGGQPSVNVSLLYDQQSVVNVDDYNFDGMEDLALCDGANGSYGGPSYRIYLSSRAAKKFVYSAAFTKLGSHLGMFMVDKAKKTLETFDKSGCCLHYAQTYKVLKNKPKLIQEVNEYYNPPTDPGFIVTETKKLINGKWRTSEKREKIPPQ